MARSSLEWERGGWEGCDLAIRTLLRTALLGTPPVFFAQSDWAVAKASGEPMEFRGEAETGVIVAGGLV
ncbi:hypothetical protein LG322_01730 [Microbacterium aerolatum]|uniref:hypothetical protein n=1 Tax=Microbacterium aerolatum TaxID=153731 RepID=UPI00384ED8D3